MRANAGKGRPKGVPNKSTATMKAAIQSVYDQLQAGHKEPHGHFLSWAQENETEFYKLASKLLPIQLTGEDGGPMKVSIDTSRLSEATLREIAAQGTTDA